MPIGRRILAWRIWKEFYSIFHSGQSTPLVSEWVRFYGKTGRAAAPKTGYTTQIVSLKGPILGGILGESNFLDEVYFWWIIRYYISVFISIFISIGNTHILYKIDSVASEKGLVNLEI